MSQLIKKLQEGGTLFVNGKKYSLTAEELEGIKRYSDAGAEFVDFITKDSKRTGQISYAPSSDAYTFGGFGSHLIEHEGYKNRHIRKAARPGRGGHKVKELKHEYYDLGKHLEDLVKTKSNIEAWKPRGEEITLREDSEGNLTMPEGNRITIQDDIDKVLSFTEDAQIESPYDLKTLRKFGESLRTDKYAALNNISKSNFENISSLLKPFGFTLKVPKNKSTEQTTTAQKESSESLSSQKDTVKGPVKGPTPETPKDGSIFELDGKQYKNLNMIKLDNNIYNAAYRIDDKKFRYFDHVAMEWKSFDQKKVKFLSTPSQHYIKKNGIYFKMLGDNYVIRLDNHTLYRVYDNGEMKELAKNLPKKRLYSPLNVNELKKIYLE